MKHTYFLADTTHSWYNWLVVSQENNFKKLRWYTNHKMIVNLAWTNAFCKIFWELPKIPESWAVLDSDFNPNTRTMSEWDNDA